VGKISGLRQTYFSNHRLQISRLTPVHDELSFRDAVVKELARTHQYLKSLSLLPPGQILDVRIMCHRNDLNLLQSELPVSQDMRYDYADIEAIAGTSTSITAFPTRMPARFFCNALLQIRRKLIMQIPATRITLRCGNLNAP